MELKVKELCKKRGLTMGQLADKMGVNLSNLSASINGNPTLERLKDIAKNLGVEVYELFKEPSESSGIIALADIAGEKIKITTAEEWAAVTMKVPGLVRIPYYSKDSDLLKDLRSFIEEGAEKYDIASMTGQYLGREIFCLSRRPEREYVEEENAYNEDEIYILTIFSTGYTAEYSLIEYWSEDGYEIDGDCGMAMHMRNEIEKFTESTESSFE